jgi:hypothetical protein
MEVEVINLSSISVANGQWALREIPFDAAKLMLVTQYGDKLWYIDIDGVTDSELMEWLANSEDIRITFDAVSESGQRLSGTAYAHPNMAHRALAIRGEGELRQL